MEDMRALRKNWVEVERVERALWQRRPMAEKVARYLELRRLFASRLEQTRARHRHERLAYLAELQSRLRRLAEYQSGCAPSHSDGSPS